jgi:hypothetical protein
MGIEIAKPAVSTPPYAIKTPNTPPRPASTKLSVSTWRTMRQRLAPSAVLTAISRWRATARDMKQVRDVGAGDEEYDERHA